MGKGVFFRKYNFMQGNFINAAAAATLSTTTIARAQGSSIVAIATTCGGTFFFDAATVIRVSDIDMCPTIDI